MNSEFDYIIVGAGVAGITLARELSKENTSILLIERGGYVKRMGTVMSAGFLYDRFATLNSSQNLTIYRTFGMGGTSIVSCFNAVELSKDDYDVVGGIDLGDEFEAISKECSIGTNCFPLGRASMKIMETANKLGYHTKPMPKFGRLGKCVSCGNCICGCRFGAKWTPLEFLKDIKKEKVTIVTGFPVTKVICSNGQAIGVEGGRLLTRGTKYYGKKIILAAGGIGTPVILQNSGVDAGEGLFVDIFNVTYGFHKEYEQCREPAMTVLCDKFRKTDGFILSPFIDNYFAFLNTMNMRDAFKVFKLKNMMGIMTKINDDGIGRIEADGRIRKVATSNDLIKINKGISIAKEILISCGVRPRDICVSNLRGAHPGGTASIGKVVDNNLETDMANLFVCDASVFKRAPGVPPIVTIIALAKWLSKKLQPNKQAA